MGQTLYRKHRPKKLSEIVGQEHVTTTLDNAMKSGRVAHAYLFTGPPGVGKTSIARILAHELNNLPYTDESFHMDIIEIDAASNRRIDEIRDLRDKVHISPTSAKYKVYIIDEVHMLTKEAFNALLKTLEEPPAHVIFILATTEAHKLPETIISRTQRFSFKPVESKKVVEHLRNIAKTKKITIDDAALELIAAHGEGSFRDSISLLDQAGNMHDKITVEHIQEMLGIAPHTLIETIITQLTTGSPGELMKLLESLPANGYQATTMAKQVAAYLRTHLRSGTLPIPASEALRLMSDLLVVPTSSDPELLFVLHLVGSQLRLNPQGVPSVPAPKSEPLPEAAPKPLKNKEASKSTEVEQSSEEPASKPTQEEPTRKGQPFDAASWERMLQRVKTANHGLYTAVRMSKPEVTGTRELTLHFQFKLHQKKVDESQHKKIVAESAGEIMGGNWRILCAQGIPAHLSFAEETPEPESEPIADSFEIADETHGSVLDIFGGGEVLES